MSMENSEAAKKWANQIAHYVTDALISAGVIVPADNAKSVSIIEEEVWAQFCMKYAAEWQKSTQPLQP